MNSNLSIWQRFLADTPPFFKKVHAIGIFLVGLAFTLSQTTPIIPAKWLLVLGFVGLAIALLSTFAVKDIALIQSGTPLTLESITGIVSDLSSQFNEVKGLITAPPADLSQINTIVNDTGNALPVQKPVLDVTSISTGPAPQVQSQQPAAAGTV